MTTIPQPDPVVRSGAEERDYLLKRAEDHRGRAAKSAEQGAKSVHQRLTRLYENRAASIIMVVPD